MWVAVGVISALYATGSSWLSHQARRAPPADHYDAIVVLGCRVRPDGTASPTLARRARHAAELYRRGLAPIVVTTGGVGDHPPSEASAAAVILQRHGVPAGAIVLEERSTSTEENAREAAARVEAARVLVVTDDYHAFRAERVFARYFARAHAVGSAGTRSVRIRGALREVMAVGSYALLGRL